MLSFRFTTLFLFLLHRNEHDTGAFRFLSFVSRLDARTSSSGFGTRVSSASSTQGAVSSSGGGPLIPEENPDLDETKESLSGVRYNTVLDGLHHLYPPAELGLRNAASRTDGYWPYINKGKDPPQKFTYGEFDFFFFAELLDKAHGYFHEDAAAEMPSSTWGNNDVFVDIGSGAGRLVMGAAALHPEFRVCRGIEILPSIHKVALEKLQRCRVAVEDEEEEAEAEGEGDEWVSVDSGLFVPQTPKPSKHPEAEELEPFGENCRLPLSSEGEEGLRQAAMEFRCGSFEDPFEYFGDASCIFVFSSCLSESLMQSLSKAIGRQCKPGTIVITTEFPLELEGECDPVKDHPNVPSGSYKLELLESVDGYVWLTGGESTAYIHRVVESQWTEGTMLKRSEQSVEDYAYDAMTSVWETTDRVQFIREVRNEMVFHGFPDFWLPPTDADSMSLDDGWT